MPTLTLSFPAPRNEIVPVFDAELCRTIGHGFMIDGDGKFQVIFDRSLSQEDRDSYEQLFEECYASYHSDAFEIWGPSSKQTFPLGVRVYALGGLEGFEFWDEE